jgi:6-phosphogluconolactonase
MTTLIHFHHAATAQTLAQDVADHVAQRLRDGLRARGQVLLVVSGGSTPVPFFDALARCPLDWSRVLITLADERWLPPEHADSNARLVLAHLLQGEAARARFVPLYNGADTPNAGHGEIEQALAALPWPAEVVVLGMGGDGHTASLFPAAPELPVALAGVDAQDLARPLPRCMAVAAPALPNVPVARLTLTARALLDTRCVLLHVTGASKWALLQDALKSGPREAWPIRLALHQDRVPCEVFHAD